MPKIIKNKLIEEFKDRGSFTKKELFDFYLQYEPELKESTFAWRIYDLKSKNIIKSIKRGIYVICNKPLYSPAISNDILELANHINAFYYNVKYCIWDTSWLNEFSHHQTSKKVVIIEIINELTESFFYQLKNDKKYDIYLKPDEKAINYYISESSNPVIIKRLVTRSPVEKNRGIFIPTLEKILVDIYTDNKIFYYYQGPELMNIYENAIKKYTLNFTTLFSYANRRERENEVKAFMVNHMSKLVKEIIDD